MTSYKKIGIAFLGLIVILGAYFALNRGREDSPPLILAAASLQESMIEAADAWAAQGHVRPTISFAASSALARQIESGAKADLFISADEKWMDYLQERNLLMAGTRSTFLGNRLVLIAPQSSTVNLTISPNFALAQALGNGRLSMADPDAVPAGRYGKQALENLGVWPQVENKIARAENVRAALALVERAEAPLGIVYSTDARASDKVRIISTFPQDIHAPIRYPISRIATSDNEEAEAFRKFLISDDGKAIFVKHGFSAQ